METSKSRRSPGFNSWTTVFLVYINDIYSNLSTNVKLFADYNFLFSIWNDANESFENVSNVLQITGLTDGKCLLTQIDPNKLQKLFSQEKSLIQSHTVLTLDNTYNQNYAL